MKKILFVLLVFFGSFFNANATFVSGNITTNTTWTVVNSPYIVNGNLTVDSGVVLTIQAGVDVLIDSTYFFKVDGTLLAVGTSADIISFTANSVNPALHPWEGISFTPKSIDTSRFDYCVFTYADVAVYTDGAKLKISNSTFKHNNIAIHINSMQYNSSNYTYINKCLVTQNDTGIYDSGNWLINSKVTENEISFNSIGLREENSRIGLRNFNYNNFNYNAIGYSSTGQQFGSRLNTFKGNTVYGVSVTPSSPENIGYISENLFIYNATAINIDNADRGQIYYNTIAYNGIGIVDDFTHMATTSRNYSSLNYNCYISNTLYNIKENGRFDLPTKNDWWGTTNTLTIDTFIYDFYDNSAKGKVTYTPIATNNSGCKTVSPPPPCLQPDSLNLIATSSTAAVASWSSVANAPGYEYYMIPLSSGPPSAGVVTMINSASITGLTPGASYVFCVRTKCQASPFLSSWVCDTVTMPCSELMTINIGNISSHSATVSWNSAEAVSKYEYYVLRSPSTPPAAASSTTSSIVTVTGLEPGVTYDVCARCVCGNQSSNWTCNTISTPTGIDDLGIGGNVSIYPNPSKGTFTVSLSNMSYSNANIVVYDVTGRMILTKRMYAGNETVDMVNAAKGVYLLRVLTDSAVINKHIVIE